MIELNSDYVLDSLLSRDASLILTTCMVIVSMAWVRLASGLVSLRVMYTRMYCNTLDQLGVSIISVSR